MRCISCSTYIPEGLGELKFCPQCGKGLTKLVTTIESSSEPSGLVESSGPAEEVRPEVSLPKREPYAKFLTSQTRLSLDVVTNGFQSTPGIGSISFGRDGFSIVFDEGRGWKKFAYLSTGSLRQDGERVMFNSSEGIPYQLVLYTNELSMFPSLARKAKASTFIELVSKIPQGLNSTQVHMYHKKLSA